MSTHSENDRLRIGDVDRNFVSTQLQKAVGDGLITLSEFTERADAVAAAKTRGDLAAVVADLPGVHVAVTDAAPDSARLGALMSSVERAGRWVVPKVLEVRNTMGTIKIDLVDAVIEGNHAVIDVRNHMGTVVVIVPAGTVVDSSGVTNRLGSVKNKVRGGKSSGLTVTVRGSTTMGTLKFRPPLSDMLRNLGI